MVPALMELFSSGGTQMRSKFTNPQDNFTWREEIENRTGCDGTSWGAVRDGLSFLICEVETTVSTS